MAAHRPRQSSSRPLLRDWRPLGSVPPAALVAPRIQLHYAAQAVSMVGRGILPREPDFDNASLRVTRLRGQPLAVILSGRRIPGPRHGDFMAALRLAPQPALLELTAAGSVRGSLPLEGRTLTDLMGWLRGVAADHGAPAERIVLRLASDSPASHLATSGRFDLDRAGPSCEELADWFRNGWLAVRAIAARSAEATPVRCWTHHFDLATLLPVATPEGSEARTIGVGLSPGDVGLPIPYFYVTPWPYPEPVDLPPLAPGARWTTEGWFGALLPGDVLVRHRAPAEQASVARVFIAEAVAAARGLLERAGPPPAA